MTYSGKGLLSEITRDIDDPKWREMSVEFCGGT